MNIELNFQKKTIGVGRRKRASARVFIIPGQGKLKINKVNGEQYLQYNMTYINNIWFPLQKVNLANQFDIIALVQGGGLTSQTKAIQLAITRLLCKMNGQNRIILKSLGLLTQDTRIKERKKYGLRKARKAPQYSKR